MTTTVPKIVPGVYITSKTINELASDYHKFCEYLTDRGYQVFARLNKNESAGRNFVAMVNSKSQLVWASVDFIQQVSCAFPVYEISELDVKQLIDYKTFNQSSSNEIEYVANQIAILQKEQTRINASLQQYKKQLISLLDTNKDM